MVVVNVASFVTGIATERRSRSTRNNPMAPMFGVYAQTAVEIFERDGRSAMRSYLDRVDKASQISTVLLDDRGTELSGSAVPEGAQEIAKRVNDESPFLFDFPKPRQRPLGAQVVRSAQGRLYILVAELPKPDFP